MKIWTENGDTQNGFARKLFILMTDTGRPNANFFNGSIPHAHEQQ
jgi:hypothetical protein